MSPDRRNVAIVLVEYHSDGLVAQRAAEARRAGFEVVVADNSGRYTGPGTIVRTAGNVGFGAACNAAVASLPPQVDVVVLQNPDATLGSEDISTLVAFLRDGGWSALAPAISAGSARRFGFAVPGPAREFPLVVMDCLHASGLRVDRVRDRLRAIVSRDDHGFRDVVRGPVIRTGRFGTAAFLVVSRNAFEEVGGFDERYFLYVEDLDLWERLRERGRVGFVPAVVAEHQSGAGSSAPASQRVLLRWLGREMFARGKGSAWWWLRLCHRLGLLCLPRNADPVTDVLATGMRSWRPPESLQAEVRASALRSMSTPGTTGASVRRDHLRAGWSRTRMSVADGELVLDVGSGAFPNPRADVLCERSLVREHRIAVTDRPTVVADAEALPLRRGSFGLAIASHLAEHVAHPDVLCAELSRVAGRCYIETPSPAFERLFPSENHLWIVRKIDHRTMEFALNERTSGAWQRAGARLRPWYYAAAVDPRSGSAPSRFLRRLLARISYVIRGSLNRAGLTVTRGLFDSAVGIDVRFALPAEQRTSTPHREVS